MGGWVTSYTPQGPPPPPQSGLGELNSLSKAKPPGVEGSGTREYLVGWGGLRSNEQAELSRYTPYAILAKVRPARYLSFPTLATLRLGRREGDGKFHLRCDWLRSRGGLALSAVASLVVVMPGQSHRKVGRPLWDCVVMVTASRALRLSNRPVLPIAVAP